MYRGPAGVGGAAAPRWRRGGGAAGARSPRRDGGEYTLLSMSGVRSTTDSQNLSSSKLVSLLVRLARVHSLQARSLTPGVSFLHRNGVLGRPRTLKTSL